MEKMMERIGKFVVEDVPGAVSKGVSAAAKGMKKVNEGMQGALNSLKLAPGNPPIVKENAEGIAAMARKKKADEAALKY